MHLVLLRLSALGDILRVLPAWMNLHEAFPEARIQGVVEDRHAFLLEPFPWLEPVIVHRKRLSTPVGAVAELKRVANIVAGAEVSLDFHGILKAALIPKWARIPERWGDGVTKEGSRWLQTNPLSFCYQSRYSQALGLAKAFGESRGVQGLGQFRPVLREARLPEPAEQWCGSTKPRIVFVPGASRRGAIKRWPLRHWITLARMLKDRYELRWSLGPEEEELRDWLPVESGVSALPNQSLWELAATIRQADCVIAPDTGLLHMAVVLGVRVIGVYGASDPIIAGLPEGSGEILRTGIACSPCRERGCQRRQCMEDLDPEFVAARLGIGPS
jgi:ADP-heptose:LPS heptosyltransferase